MAAASSALHTCSWLPVGLTQVLEAVQSTEEGPFIVLFRRLARRQVPEDTMVSTSAEGLQQSVVAALE